ncbi:protein PHLOEM PROTEIN 2-LIKE A10-like [Curcuma longa]|uniref:protein PHLOEM PROTEIN 2-LIKE A10-like n=1 Tax=Curcuma longa TaxID=136217 RepID=UPI003D9F1B3B
MALQFASSALDISRRRRRWLILAVAVGFSGYGAYRLYHRPSVARRRSQLARLFNALVSVSEAVALVSDDLNRFLRSENDEIPTSLKQLAKIAASKEFTASVSRFSEAVTVGIARGLGSASEGGGKVGSCGLGPRIVSPGFSDRFFEKLFSPAGTGFASIVVGSFARNLVLAIRSGGTGAESVGRHNDEAIPTWFRLLSDDNSREFMADCIQQFVSTAVTVYLEKTMVINPYDQIFSGLTNPEHEAKMKDILVSVCNGAVETLVKTSYRVMNNKSSLTSSVSRVNIIGQEGEVLEQLSNRQRNCLNDHNVSNSVAWAERVSSTLAVPCNRKLVLDVTGRVTFETVRSFLNFLSWKLSDSARRGASVIHKEVAERGLEVVRYVSAKSLAAITICLALCMQLCVGTRFLTPA